MNTTYKQKTKSNARNMMLAHAVNALTSARNQSCCVNRTYVRNLLNHFKNSDDTKEQKEAEKIEINYVTNW